VRLTSTPAPIPSLAVPRIVFLSALAALCAACPFHPSLFRPPGNTTRDSLNLKYGVSGPTGRVLDKGYYVINYNDLWRIPHWSAYRLTPRDLLGTSKRQDNFRPDPEVPKKAQSTLEDYKGSGLDRGHLAPAGNFTRSNEAMAATFLLSNISPQHPSTNRGIWRQIESQIRHLVQAADTTWVVTGDAFMNEDSLPVDPKTWIKRGNQNRVAVPTHLFNAILTLDAKGHWRAYAFLVPNLPTRNPNPTSKYQLSVDNLERTTGFDFFVDLDTAVQNRIESTAPTLQP